MALIANFCCYQQDLSHDLPANTIFIDSYLDGLLQRRPTGLIETAEADSSSCTHFLSVTKRLTIP